MLKQILTLTMVMLLAACDLARVNTDYDPNVQFDGMGRYAWAPQPPGANSYESLDRQRMRSAVDNILAQRAMRPVPPAEAQVWVDAGVELKPARDVSTMEIGTTHWHPLLIGGETVVRVDDYTQGHIYVQFISPKDSRVIWRGVVVRRWNDGLAPMKRERLLQEAAAKILAAFPPH